jgi:hypothetical protein
MSFTAKKDHFLSQATKLDAEDPLKDYRQRFLFPQHKGKEVLQKVYNT